jgi:hypothetical protein
MADKACVNTFKQNNLSGQKRLKQKLEKVIVQRRRWRRGEHRFAAMRAEELARSDEPEQKPDFEKIHVQFTFITLDIVEKQYFNIEIEQNIG